MELDTRDLTILLEKCNFLLVILGWEGNRAALGGQAAITERLDNVPGFDEGIEGARFGEKLRRQAERFGVELLQAQDVVNVYDRNNYHCIDTADGSQYSACALLLATGSRYRRLGVSGEEN
jgi:thioredoxin reductase (NADPH)